MTNTSTTFSTSKQFDLVGAVVLILAVVAVWWLARGIRRKGAAKGGDRKDKK